MDFKEYEKQIKQTDVGTAAQDSLKPGWLYYVLGIAGESGELMEKVKKLFRDHDGNLSTEIIKGIMLEMGDILWYMARLANWLGFSLEDAANANVEKLLSRKKRNKLHGDGDYR